MWRALRQGVLTLAAAAATRVAILADEGGRLASDGDIEEFPDFRFEPGTPPRFHEDNVLPALLALLGCKLTPVAAIEGARFGATIGKLGFPMAPARGLVTLPASDP